MFSKPKHHRKLFTGMVIVTLAALLALSGIQVAINPDNVEDSHVVITIGTDKFVFSLSGAEAATVTDYTCDGVADDVQFQAALNALPATGGKLEVLGGVYNFTATVSRAIDDVTIEGVGQGTYFAYDGVSAIFTAGSQDSWVFRDFSTDAGGVTTTNATYTILDNVWEGGVRSGDVRSSTLVVAATDASDLEKAGADYICDGTADEVQINAAFSALPGSEGTVQLTRGTFTCAAAVSMPENTTMVGQGFNATILNFGALNSVYVGVNLGGSLGIGGAIRDLTITGGASAASAIGVQIDYVQNFLISNCRIGTIATAVQFEDGAHAGLIHKSEILGFVDAVLVGASGAACNGVSITDSLITHRGGNGVRGLTGADLVIAGNYFESATPTVAAGDAIYLENGCDRTHILNNYFDVGASDVESIVEVTSSSNDHIIAGNMMYGDCSDDILLITSAYHTIANNVLQNGAAAAIYIEGGGARIIGNYLRSNGTRAIDASVGQRGLIIEGNQIYLSGTEGIYLNAYSDCSSVVQGNFVYLTQGDGIYVTGVGAVVNGNSIVDCNQSAGTEYGIYANNLTYGIITDNHVKGAAHDYGIYEAGSSNYNIIENNVLKDNIAAMSTTGANTIVRNNVGYITENYGTATLLNGNTTVVVAHGCSATPTVIVITFAENPTNALGDWWVDTIGATNFTFNGVDPGASNLDFYWAAYVR